LKLRHYGSRENSRELSRPNCGSSKELSRESGRDYRESSSVQSVRQREHVIKKLLLRKHGTHIRSQPGATILVL
jgi:hypothetical protein